MDTGKLGIELLPRLETCLEEQTSRKSFELERLELSKLGIITSSPAEVSILFRAINDIIVAVSDSDPNTVILATASSKKVEELMSVNCLIPRSKDLSLENKLIQGINPNGIMEHLKNGRFKLIQLVPTAKLFSLFTCSLSAFNPYPDFKGYSVYTLSSYANWYNQLNSILIKSMVKVGYLGGEVIGSLGSTAPKRGDSESYLKPAMCLAFTLNVVDISGSVVSIPVFSVKSMTVYVLSDLERFAIQGIISLGGKLYTANRSVLEKYYGDYLYTLESLNVRKRWALEDILRNPNETVSSIYSRYKFNVDKTVPFMPSLQALVEYLLGSLDTSALVRQKLTLRILINPKSLSKVSYYRAIDLSLQHEYAIVDQDTVFEQSYLFCGVSKDFGYQVIRMEILAGVDVQKRCIAEFTRQFGSCLDYRKPYNVVKEEGTYPFNIPLDMQRKLAEVLNVGDYVNNFASYKAVLSSILNLNKLKFDDDVLRYGFINKYVQRLKVEHKTYAGDFSIISVILLSFLESLVGISEDEIRVYNFLSKLETSYASKVTGYLNMVKKTNEVYDYSLCDISDKPVSMCLNVKKSVLVIKWGDEVINCKYKIKDGYLSLSK